MPHSLTVVPMDLVADKQAPALFYLFHVQRHGASRSPCTRVRSSGTACTLASSYRTRPGSGLDALHWPPRPAFNQDPRTLTFRRRHVWHPLDLNGIPPISALVDDECAGVIQQPRESHVVQGWLGECVFAIDPE